MWVLRMNGVCEWEKVSLSILNNGLSLGVFHSCTMTIGERKNRLRSD